MSLTSNIRSTPNRGGHIFQGACPESVHCGQARSVDLDKRNATIIDTSIRQIFGQHGVCGQLDAWIDSMQPRSDFGLGERDR